MKNCIQIVNQNNTGTPRSEEEEEGWSSGSAHLCLRLLAMIILISQRSFDWMCWLVGHVLHPKTRHVCSENWPNSHLREGCRKKVVFLPRSHCSRFWSISVSVLALAIFVSYWYVIKEVTFDLDWKDRNWKWIPSIFSQYFKMTHAKKIQYTTPTRSKTENPTRRTLLTRWTGVFSHMKSKI